MDWHTAQEMNLYVFLMYPLIGEPSVSYRSNKRYTTKTAKWRGKKAFLVSFFTHDLFIAFLDDSEKIISWCIFASRTEGFPSTTAPVGLEPGAFIYNPLKVSFASCLKRGTLAITETFDT